MSESTRCRKPSARPFSRAAVAGMVVLVGAGVCAPTGAAGASTTAASTVAVVEAVDRSQALVEFELPNRYGAPTDVVAGSDGSVWVSVFADKQILHLDGSGQVLRTVQLEGAPSSLTSDDAGGVWATGYTSNSIAHVNAAGAKTEYPIPTAATFPANIDVFNGFVYFTESNAGALARLDPLSGFVAEYRLPGSVTPWDVRGDSTTGTIFVTDPGKGTVWERTIDGGDQGEFTAAGPITQFGERTGSKDTATLAMTDRDVRRLALSAPRSQSELYGNGGELVGAVEVTSRGDQLWFADVAANRIGYVNPDGTAGSVSPSEANASLAGLAVTEDRYVWTIEKALGKLARIDIVAATTDRIGGSDRYETAVAVARSAYPAGAGTVFLASGENFADALSAGPIAAASHAPLLLTARAALPGVVATGLTALSPSKVVLAGGTAAVSEQVVEAVRKAIPGVELIRVGGADRYQVSANLLALAPAVPSIVYIATGRDFPDALTAGPVASHDHAVILLVDGKAPSLTASTKNYLAGKKAYLVGGALAVSAGIEADLAAQNLLEARIGGADRFAVSLALNANWGAKRSTYLASGVSFADALAGGATAGAQGRPIYLSRTNCVPTLTVDRLRSSAAAITVLGGTAALEPTVAALDRCEP